MTEKRFTKDFECPNNFISFIYDNGDVLTTGEVVGLLNELNDKCEFLEIEDESLEDGATRYAELYHKSLKENEQLKSRVEYLERKINRERKSHFIQDEKWQTESTQQITKLKKENEQLKKEIEKLSYANEDLLEEKRIWKQMSDEYAKLSDENEQLKTEINMLKITIGRNEGYIGGLTHKGEWR